MVDKIKFTGELEKTVARVWLENGALMVEHYDFNDVAYTLTVKEMGKLYSLAVPDEVPLIPWLVEKFKVYFGIEHWLKENGIDFEIERESWA